MKKLGFILLGGIILAVSAIGLRAQSQLAEFDSRFKAFDKNNDGVISGDEMNSAGYLKMLDADKNGTLTRDEALQSVRKTQKLVGEGSDTGSLFKRLDKNADGRLTEEELPNKRWFTGLDADKDGSVTLDEAVKTLASLRKRGTANSPTTSSPIKPASEDPSFKEAPQMLKGSEHGVGRMVDDLVLKTPDGKDIKLSAAAGKNGLVIALFSASCPISGKLAPETVRLEKELEAQKVKLLLVNAPPGQKSDEITKFISDHGLKSKVALDADGTLAQTLAATTTTEVFLLDATRTLVYRGALNDQYGLGYAKEQPAPLLP